MTWSQWMLENCGYKTISTFWDDFTIAERSADPIYAIQDTFDRAFKEWKGDYKMLTELVMVLNHKIWMFYEKENTAYAEVYNSLWEQADAYALDNLKGEELNYFMSTTD